MPTGRCCVVFPVEVLLLILGSLPLRDLYVASKTFYNNFTTHMRVYLNQTDRRKSRLVHRCLLFRSPGHIATGLSNDSRYSRQPHRNRNELCISSLCAVIASFWLSCTMPGT